MRYIGTDGRAVRGFFRGLALDCSLRSFARGFDSAIVVVDFVVVDCVPLTAVLPCPPSHHSAIFDLEVARDPDAWQDVQRGDDVRR